MDVKRLQEIARLRRTDAITMICAAGAGHIGGAMSVMDILTVLYYDVMRVYPDRPCDPARDYFILSKGHSCEGYIAILADLGFFPRAELNTFSRAGSRLIGHPNNKVPGVEMCTGALGHGLPAGVGMALAAKYQKKDNRVYVVMGDGEQEEGSVWEAAMAGAHYKLDNLLAIIDRNHLQISGTTEYVAGLDPLSDKWRAFGWDVDELDGHDIEALKAYFHSPASGRPRLLIAHTVKGKGLEFAENMAEWHHKVPTSEQYEQALSALGVKEVRF